MQDPRNRFLGELLQIFADIDDMVPQYRDFAGRYKGLAMAGQVQIPPALGVIEESIDFILADIERAREGDILAALQTKEISLLRFRGSAGDTTNSGQKPGSPGILARRASERLSSARDALKEVNPDRRTDYENRRCRGQSPP